MFRFGASLPTLPATCHVVKQKKCYYVFVPDVPTSPSSPLAQTHALEKKARAPTDSRHSIVIPPPDRGSPRPCPYLYPIYPCAAQQSQSAPLLVSAIIDSSHPRARRRPEPARRMRIGPPRRKNYSQCTLHTHTQDVHTHHMTLGTVHAGTWMDRYRTRTAT